MPVKKAQVEKNYQPVVKSVQLLVNELEELRSLPTDENMKKTMAELEAMKNKIKRAQDFFDKTLTALHRLYDDLAL